MCQFFNYQAIKAIYTNQDAPFFSLSIEKYQNHDRFSYNLPDKKGAGEICFGMPSFLDIGKDNETYFLNCHFL